MWSPLATLNVHSPIIVAPMAGGATTTDLVIAATTAGSLGFLAAGYKTPDVLAEQIAAVRKQTQTFGVNLFAPNPVPVDPSAFRDYAAALQTDADGYGLQLANSEPVEDDDYWADKIDLLLSNPVPVVSFTFGIPPQADIRALRMAGTITIQTVTNVDEARGAEEAGVDALAVQARAAGGHSGTLTPQEPPAAVPLSVLIATIQAGTTLPIIGAGGISTATDVAAVLNTGAAAVMVGTVLLRSDESGASTVHKAAIADPSRGRPVLTRAFTGRPARGLPNRFIEKYTDRAPLGYPAIHHLTSGLRKASAAAGNPELVNLWAGTGYRNATAEPAASILTRLAGALSF